MMSTKPRESTLFRLVIVASVAFLLTVLGMVAAAFAPPNSGLTRFFDQHALEMLGAEVMGILGFGILAMAFDRRPTSSDEVQLPANHPSDRSS